MFGGFHMAHGKKGTWSVNPEDHESDMWKDNLTPQIALVSDIKF